MKEKTLKRTARFEDEINRLMVELKMAMERVDELEDTRKAMLYMLEDLNETTAAITRAKMQWEATFDGISDPLFIHDSTFKVIRCNMAYQRYCALPFDEIIGRPYYEVFPRMEGPFGTCLRASESGQEEGEEEVTLPDIGKIFKLRSSPVTDFNGRYIHSIHILEDITEEKNAEEKIRQEMEVTTNLLMIAETTALTTDMNGLMDRVVESVKNIIGCAVVLSYLWDKDREVFRPCEGAGLDHELIPLFRTEPLNVDAPFIKSALDDGQPAFVRKPELVGMDSQAGSPFQWIKGVSSIAIIPLIGRRGCLGLLIGVCRGKDEECIFHERQKKLIHGISRQVTIALEEAKSYKDSIDRTMELSRKIETIQVMHEIDRSILSTLESQEILETAVNMIAKVIPCDRATVALVDRDRGGFVYAAGFGVPFLEKGGFVPLDATSASEVVKTMRPQYIADFKEQRDILPLERNFMDRGFLSHMRVPLMVKGEVIGVLNVGSKRTSAFTPEDLSTLEKLSSQVSLALENSRLVNDLEDLFLGTVRTLSEAIDAKSHWTRGHSERVTEIALEIGKELGFDERELKDLELSGLLHDIGKLGTYEAVLDKKGKLTEQELDIIRQHPAKGAEILSPIKQLKGIIPAIKYHHEFYDGRGYPEGLRGDDIPLFARVLAVADTVDAMSSDRPYRKGKSMEEIMEELKRCSGTQFDSATVDAFLRVLEKPGSVMTLMHKT